MDQTSFDRILTQIALTSHTTVSEVREKMQHAMDAALKNPDPAVQAMWASVPRAGDAPTLEEFMDHLIAKNMLLP